MDKKNITLRVRCDLIQKAKDTHLNLSSFFEIRLQEWFQAEGLTCADYVQHTHNTRKEFDSNTGIKQDYKMGSERFELSTSAMSRRRHNH